MKLLRDILVMATVLLATNMSAQELNCTVEIDHSQIQGTNTSVFQTLREAIGEYINTRKWTHAQFAPNEKIDCKLFLTVKTYEDPRIAGDLQIQSSRPVFNSSYTTPLINFKDMSIDFEYQEGEPLIFSENTMESNLTAILNFYVYLILATDFDSFSPRGGDPMWSAAKQVVQMAQSSGATGWRAFEDNKNRSAVISAFTDPATITLRDMIYQYHRQGLDQMSVSPDKGRAAVTRSLDILHDIAQKQPMSVGLSMFKDAKLDELVNIYSKSTDTERKDVYTLLYDLYPAETTRLERIRRAPDKH